MQCIFALVSPLPSYVFESDSETSAVSKRKELSCVMRENPFLIPRVLMADVGDQAKALSISRAKILAKET